MATSPLPLLAKKFDGIEVIARAPNHVVFENNPYVNKLTVWPEDEAPQDALTWQRRLAARGAEYDACYNLSHTCEAALAFLEGQTDFHRPASVRRKLCDESYLGRVHDMCEVEHTFAPQFYPTDEEMVRAADTIGKIRTTMHGPVVGWCISGSRIDKLYPYTAFAISRLIVELGCNVVMFGAPIKRDFDIAKAVQAQVKVTNGSDHGLHLAMSPDGGDPNPVWPIRRILTQAQYFDAVISPDTGPAWAVAMCPTPKIILLSHASAKNIVTGWVNTVALHADPKRVDCWPCHRLHESWDTCRKAKEVEAAACMTDISVEAIVGALRNALGARL